jgi:hypothetical protein
VFDEIVQWPDQFTDPGELAAALTVLRTYARDRPQLEDRASERELTRLLGLPLSPWGWHPLWSEHADPPGWGRPPPLPVLTTIDADGMYEQLGDRWYKHVRFQEPDSAPLVGTPLGAATVDGRTRLTVVDPVTVPPTPGGSHAVLRAANTATEHAEALTEWAGQQAARSAAAVREEAAAAQDLAQACYGALGASTAAWLPTVKALVRVDLSVRAEKSPPPPIVPVRLRVNVP